MTGFLFAGALKRFDKDRRRLRPTFMIRPSSIVLNRSADFGFWSRCLVSWVRYPKENECPTAQPGPYATLN